jgi:RNA polymerase sigma factor (sigma-70 family)
VNEQTDQQLLQEFATAQSDSAFAELVRRHVDLVYSAARRMVRDEHLAKDVTQGVFLALAQNSHELTSRPVLEGWLHRTSQNLASKLVRTEVRRRVREQEAASMKEIFTGEPDAKWEQIAPHLDEALGELNEADRGAILLRYFEKKSAREIAAQFGISEEAAHKRTTRSVQRLRDFFARRGVTVGVSGLVALVGTNGMQAAPTGLAGAVSMGVTVGYSAVASTTPTIGSLKVITSSWKFLLVGVATIAASTAIVVQHNKSEALNQEIQKLHAQVQKSQAEKADLVERLKSARQPAVSFGNQAELLQLRNEVGRLRAELRKPATPLAFERGPVLSTNQINETSDIPNAARNALLRKLETIKVNLNAYMNRPLGEVLKELKDESKRHDPNGKGVNFILNNHAKASGRVAENPESVDMQTILITLPELSDSTVTDVMEWIVNASATPIVYTVEAYAVVFTPKSKLQRGTLQ